ncbi:hypothetical protein C7S15_7433 [Burkholderia cepacia]|nr:hypothetical protein [Burkholderia cepacia]
MQHEGFANRGRHLCGLEGGFDGVAVEKQESGVCRHVRASAFGATQNEGV